MIINLNTLRISYCCPINVGNSIKQHSSKILSKTNDNNNPTCNCKSKANCPLNGECLTWCLVYKAMSTTSNNILVYYGTSEWVFKTQYNNHTNLSNTVIAWMRWIYKNMCRTLNTMVLIRIYHGKSIKGPHHTNVVQNSAIYVCRKKFPVFVLIQALY